MKLRLVLHLNVQLNERLEHNIRRCDVMVSPL